MPYRRNNYDFVIDSSFQPFSMQELLTPMLMYKENFEKMESAYEDLSSKADKFKYLSQTLPEGSQSRQIYEGYANELNQQAEDLAKNGLSMSNRRALTNLKRRYQGEIGRLDLADQALQEERKLRRQMSAKDSSMLYALDNLNIDSFLDGNTPNLYSISGNDLYTKGAALGKAASSRIYKAGDAGSVLGGYYRNWKELKGVSQESIADFMNSEAVQQEVDNMLKAEGVTGNLIGANYEKARQQVLNGIYTGIVYEENNNIKRDEGVMSASERATDARSRDSQALTAAMYGYKKENGKWVKDPKATPVKGGGKSGSSSSGKGGSNSRYTQLPKGVRVEWDDDPTVSGATYTSKDLDSSPSSETEHKGTAVTYDELPQYAKDRVDAILGPEGNVDLHRYWFRPYESGTFDDTEAILEILPYKVSIFNGEDDSDMLGDKDLEGGN